MENGKLYWREEEVLETDKLSLKGRHNLENILFIVSTGKLCGIESEKIREFLYHTKTLEHRMEDFYNYGKIKFINDSKATNIDSTSFAVEAYKDCTLICGGYDKKLDWVPLVELIKEHANCVYLIGDIADELNRRLLDIGYSKDKIFLLRELKNLFRRYESKDFQKRKKEWYYFLHLHLVMTNLKTLNIEEKYLRN